MLFSWNENSHRVSEEHLLPKGKLFKQVGIFTKGDSVSVSHGYTES